ncbi:MAG: pyridoxamine 5'-phosphate oxidase family protein [Firmicutes bacterium]|nr:pyridoxamine 5'-phosphate oxidase family protein [Bacillota bacterium]
MKHMESTNISNEAVTNAVPPNTSISNEDRDSFAVTGKLALVSTVNANGEPHITLLTSLQAGKEGEMIFGEFINGLSKKHIKENEKTGFLIMSLKQEWWKGVCDYFKSEITGEESEMYNAKPLFRYNTYMGIGVVHYLRLLEISEKNSISMGKVLKGIIKAKCTGVKKSGVQPLKDISKTLISKATTLKFISFINKDGYPEILPIIQAQVKDKGRLVVPFSPYAEKLKELENNQSVAIFCVNLNLTGLLLQGKFSHLKSGVGIFDIEKVYNPMPPIIKYI